MNSDPDPNEPTADDSGVSAESTGGEGDPVSETYSELEIEVSEDEFRERVEQKVEQMGGLCDEATAAKLIAHEIGDQKEVYKIDEITPDDREVKFVGEVVKKEETRTFERDDGEEGKVANVVVADETGRIRVSLWDEYAESADDLSEGDALRIKGTPKDGFRGDVEVSASEVEIDEDIEVNVDEGTSSIEELAQGMSDVSLRAKVLETSEIRTFDRDDGDEGKVANLTVGDDTGWIRVTLWDDRASEVQDFNPGDDVHVFDGYAKERDGDLELHVGNRGSVKEIDDDIEFEPSTTPIDEVEMDETYDISGVVTDSEEKRVFTRDDGTEGQVKNLRVRDETGEIKVALWGELADIQVVPGEKIVMTNVEVSDGWNGGLEGSLNWRSIVHTEGETEDVEGDDGGDEGLENFM